MGLFREIEKAASGHGHGCGCADCQEAYVASRPRGLDGALLWRIAAGAVLFAAAWVLSAPLPAASLLLAIASILCAGYDRFIRAVAGCIRERKIDEELLMAIVAVAACAIGRAVEAAAGMLLVQLAALVRGLAAERVRRSLSVLAEDGCSRLTEDASREEEFITHFARFYTPIILGLAAVMAVLFPTVLHQTVREGIYRALILMVIACPCAMILSVPLAYLAGIGGAAAQGVAVKSTGAMERLSRVGTCVFDQSAALEGGGLRVLSVRSDRMEADVLLRIAAHACAYSDGAYAEAIKAACRDTIYIELIQSFAQEPGRGITVEVDGVSIILGTEDFVREHDVDPGIDAVPETSAYLAIDGQYAGRILLGPTAKPGSAKAMEALTWDRDRRVVLLSEADAPAAEKFARLVGVGQYYARCTAEKKAETVTDLKNRLTKNSTLLYAGDARTDAACFALADVGLSVDGGTDLHAPDGDPAAAVRALTAARHAHSVVMQNVIGILAFKALVLILDMAGVCPLWLAVFADTGVSLAAALNSLRALYPKMPQLTEE